MTTLSAYRAELAVVLAFVLSRLAYFAAGIRFDATPIDHFWQFIDPVLMKTDLARSLWYLHMQPPGLNLIVGLIVQWFPHAYGPVLHALFLLIGISTGLVMVWMMKRFGVPGWLAATLTILFLIGPGTILTENLLLYEYPVMILLMIGIVALYRFGQTGRTTSSLAFFLCLLGIVYIRNQFHLLYVVVVAAALAWYFPRARKAVLWGALPALVATFLLYLKNWILFGAFTGSTWMGMVTGVTTTFQMTPEEIDRFVANGTLTPIAKIPPFSTMDQYTPFVQMPAKTGVPVLDEPLTSTGHQNFNCLAYLQVHEQYLRNSKAVLRSYPVAYLRSALIAWFAYFLPASDMHSFDQARQAIKGFDRVFNAVVYGQFLRAESRKDLRAIKASGGTLSLVLYTGTFLMIAIPLIVLWTAAQFLPRWRSRWTPAQLSVMAFMLFTILFVTAVSNAFSSFENNRYRFALDPYFVILFGAAIAALRRHPRQQPGIVSESAAAD